MNKQEMIGRLAMRHEGDLWVAYYALTDTMEGAVLLGSIKMALVVENTKCKDAFMSLMRECVSDMLEEKLGTRPTWQGAHAAPEHERSGHG